MSSRTDRLQSIAADSLAAHQRFVAECPAVLDEIAGIFVDTFRAGGKILFCGNGGSAADAQHVAGELVGRFLKDSPPWPAIALTTDSSVLTCVANDWSFDDVFARQVRALAKPGDVLVGISTSGNSANVLRAAEAGRELGCRVIGFTGEREGQLAALCDVCFQAPAAATPRMQELHLLAWHAICEVVEQELLDQP